jgi:hypothetical protein
MMCFVDMMKNNKEDTKISRTISQENEIGMQKEEII